MDGYSPDNPSECRAPGSPYMTLLAVLTFTCPKSIGTRKFASDVVYPHGQFPFAWHGNRMEVL